MLHKNTEKLIKQLLTKKGRQKNGLFLAEGVKSVQAFLSSGYFSLQNLVLTELHQAAFAQHHPTVTDYKTYTKLSHQEQAEGVMGIFELREFSATAILTGQHLILDRIQDPGNMGTLIRLAYWYGLDGIHLTKGCVDVYNPKVVQSTMGALGTVPIYTHEKIAQIECNVPLYIAHMEGKSIGKFVPEQTDFALVMGNEANGIDRKFLNNSSTTALSIPCYAKDNLVDSLNVAMSAGILLQALKS